MLAVGAHPGVEIGRPGHEEVDVLAVGGARRHGDVGLRTTENPGGCDDGRAEKGRRRASPRPWSRVSRWWPSKRPGRRGPVRGRSPPRSRYVDSRRGSPMLADTVGRRSATRSRVSLRALTVRPPRNQNRMTDPATAPTSAQDHNQTRAERSDISRNSASRKGLGDPASSAMVSKRTRGKARRIAHVRSEVSGEPTSASIRHPSRAVGSPTTPGLLCAWSHFCGDRPHHTPIVRLALVVSVPSSPGGGTRRG